ncbi:MAG: hypothetical protein V1816_01790 [Pseudomonadota bacterium]
MELVPHDHPDAESYLVVVGCPAACVDLTPFMNRPIFLVQDDKGADDFKPDF